jgi:transcriptional regulator GlxA family with amidase domain
MKINILILIAIIISIPFDLLSSSPKKVAILVYDEVYLMDFAGPLEIFNDCFLDDTSKCFDVYLVAESKETIKAHTGTGITPDFDFSDCPKPDILVIPGGNLNLVKEKKNIADFIVKTDKQTEITMSVCTGAFILAELGLLDNLEATTWYGAKKRLSSKYPLIKVVDKRITDNGKYITTAGVSAGVDGALHIVKRLFGDETAKNTAKYIEWEK